MQNKPSIFIAIIHNNNKQRNDVLFPNIKKLSVFLSGFYEVRVEEFSYQPNIVPITEELVKTRRKMMKILGKKWEIYKENSINKNTIGNLNIKQNYKKYLYLCSFLLKNIIKQTPKEINKNKEARTGAIEIMLTDKHNCARDSFLQSNFDYFLCFEDDATFLEDSCPRLFNVIKIVKQFDPSLLLYVDLAGGCSIDSLGLQKLFTHKDGEYFFYKKPCTNTACTYLLNREIVKKFKEILLLHPEYRYIGADWHMNQLLIDIVKLGQNQSVCFHADPVIFRHGSMDRLESTVRV